MTVPLLPPEVLAAFPVAPESTVERISIGLVNRTFKVTEPGGRRFVLQALHPVFHGRVNDDIDHITTRLAEEGVATPRVVRTRSGESYFPFEGQTFRMLTFLEGRTIEAVTAPEIAEAAAAHLARFHMALDGFDHRFAFVREGVHDTARFAEKLGALASKGPSTDQTRTVAEALIALAHRIPPTPGLPLRIVHGDLKISNVLFSLDEAKALALCDLDTLQLGTIETELGDALRSWCNPKGESDPPAVFDRTIFDATLRGYADTAPTLLTEREARSIPRGAVRMTTEVGIRFCIDVYEDRYFGWDPQRFGSRREHNLVRARSQLSLAVAIEAALVDLDAQVANTLGLPSP
ncbi:MAG: phosphotransferase [Myxococcota bacterium]